MSKPKIIAFYLPQYHPIPENDKWWGKGFTEWTNVGKAMPLFKGHEQPRVPADLGYYDLRLPEVRESQAELAKEAGIYGFCYWHYWFGNGKTLLSEIIEEVVKSGKPDFPFCLGWANHDWSRRTWNIDKSKNKNELLIKQSYPGKQDMIDHFYNILPIIKDKRYIKIDNKPIFLVFKPLDIPNCEEFISTWNELAIKEGLNKFFFVGISESIGINIKDHIFNFKQTITNPDITFQKIFEKGFDAINSRGTLNAKLHYHNKFIYLFKRILESFLRQFFSINLLQKYKYKKLIRSIFVEQDKKENVIPTIIPNFDRSPRGGKKADIWYKNDPKAFKFHVKKAFDLISHKKNKILFLMSWNEWGEGNYMEPDLKYGKEYLNALSEALDEHTTK